MTDSLTDGLKQWIKPEVAGLALAADGVRVDPAWQRLHWNENPYEFPPQLKEIVLARLQCTGWTPYPAGLRPWALIERIAERRGVNPNQVIVGPGASDLIKVILGCVLRPGDTLALPTPTFLLYRPGAQMQGAHCTAVPLAAENGFALPVDALIEAAQTHSARLTVVCAPNNPTGTVYSVAEVEQVARGCGSDKGGLLLVDAAYADFSGQDFTPLLAHENVILLHTFSKLYALAGARVGYALAAPALACELQKAISDFPLSTYAEIAAEVALEHADLFYEQARLIVAEREWLAAELRRLPGVTVYPSGTNFLLVELGVPKRPLLDHLLHEHGILLSDLAAYPELPNCMRVSVGTHQQNVRLVQGMAERL